MPHYYAALPPGVRVGHLSYRLAVVDQIDNEPDTSGHFDNNALTIRLRRDQPSRAYAVDTLLHELGHAIFNHCGLGDGASEETVVCAYAAGLTMIFHDNADLARWIVRNAASRI